MLWRREGEDSSIPALPIIHRLNPQGWAKQASSRTARLQDASCMIAACRGRNETLSRGGREDISGENEGRLPEGGDILRWIAALCRTFFCRQIDQHFCVSPGLRELAAPATCYSPVPHKLRWRAFARTPARETAFGTHALVAPASLGLWGSPCQVPESTPALAHRVPSLTCPDATGNLRKKLFQENKPNQNPHG